MRILKAAGVTLAILAGSFFLTIGDAVAQTGMPMCNDVARDPTIATCTCTCESNSRFSECQGKSAGDPASTPGQCPDMLQGRRVLSGGDALLVADPFQNSQGNNHTRSLLYPTTNDTSNPGLGVPAGSPINVVDQSVNCKGVTGQPFPQQTRFARLFDLPYDMIVTMRPVTTGSIASNCNATSSAPNLALDVRSHVSGAPTVPFLENTFNSEWMQLAIDDFDYDGFDDIFFLNVDSIQMVTAVDTSDPTKGLVHTGGVRTSSSTGTLSAPLNEPTTGDFNGDGLLDVAWIGGDFPQSLGELRVYFATVCPGDVAGTICAGADAFDVITDPASRLLGGATSTIHLARAAPLTKTACGVVQQPNNPDPAIQTGSLRAGTVALGNFEDNGFNPRGAPIDELVVAYVSGSDAIQGDLCETNVEYYSFSEPTSSSTFWARQRGSTISNVFPDATERHTIAQDGSADRSVQYKPVINLHSQATYLDWYGEVEQAVIAVSGVEYFEDLDKHNNVSSGSHWRPLIVTVSGTGEGAQAQVCGDTSDHHDHGDTSAPLVWGLAVGRFSTSTTVDPDNPSACADFANAAPGECPYNPQIAMLVAGNTGNTKKATSLRLYNVQSSQQCAFEPQFAKTIEISGYSPNNISNLRGGNQLLAGDAFGNSVRVGAPFVTRIGAHTSPQIVIQAPPSLVDYVRPTTSSSEEPAIVNFSRAPGQFNAEFVFSSAATNSASTSRTTSHTLSTSETVSSTVKLTPPDFTTVTFKASISAEQFSENNTKDQLSNYFTTGLKTGGQIGVDDQVWWTQTNLNVFHFPVIGETACPATVTCDASDPNTLGCSAAAEGVELTCSASGDGCTCLSETASASLCPAVPGSGLDVRLSCSESNGNACCTQREEQVYMSVSGPEEVMRSSAPGSLLEWYQPKHEPGQILSYPATTGLLQARTSGFESLATFDNFSTGTNSSFETFTWQCGSSQGNSIGTATRYDYEADTSLTFGTNDLAKALNGFSISAEFDIQKSDSLATLNTHTVSQSTASSVTLNLEPEAFYSTDQFAYSLSGELFGLGLPGVLDHPEADLDVDGKPPGCTTSGPLTVGFAANPAGSAPGKWWQSNPPYLQYIDVALNNPSRWRKVESSAVAESGLQCRGPANGLACYTQNELSTETDAASVWGADFYDMKGLFVTTGGIGGPQRTTARVGDEVFLQLRVYNYSLDRIAEKFPDSRVYARLYRQQLDVNEIGDTVAVLRYAGDDSGQPLPAVPIGPTGLGDPDPLLVFSPLGETTINGFNVTSDPDLDNISLATTSYVVPQGDECDEVSCEGAYYAYWATVWAEDTGGNVVGELPGHGLGALTFGAFNPDTLYEFISDVPLEEVTFDDEPATFSNNVGMYKQVFAIVPDADTGNLLGATVGSAAADPLPGTLQFHTLEVSSMAPSVGETVVVSARVGSLLRPTPGATVVFSDGDPDNGGEVFDVEMLPHIRGNDSHLSHVNYTPGTCGPHEIFVDISAGSFTERQSVPLSVQCQDGNEDEEESSGGGSDGPLWLLMLGLWTAFGAIRAAARACPEGKGTARGLCRSHD